MVAGPISDIVYFWGLAGGSGKLAMRDVGEFAFLKRLAPIMEKLDAGRERPKITAEQLDEFAVEAGLNHHGKIVLALYLRERGYSVEWP